MKKINKVECSHEIDLMTDFENTIRELKKKNRDLEVQYFQLKNLVDDLPGDIYWKDKQGVWAGINKRCAQSLKTMGFIKDSIETEVIGKTDYQLFDQRTADGYRQNDLEVMEKKTELSREEDTQLPSGEKITLLSTKRPLWDKDGNVVGIVGNTIDISYLKKIEADLLLAKEAAEAASHAKTEFIANMGHDIRTPLTGIIGMSHILEDEVQLPDEKEHATIIHESGEQLLDLLNDVLDLITADASTEDTVFHESFDVRRVIQDVLELELPAVQARQLQIESHVDGIVPPYVIGDKVKLHRILLNLAGNAIKFTKVGHIELNARLLTIKKGEAKIEFSVSDTGIGIPDELQEKVFDRFFKVSPSYKGLYTGHGIGLHIAQKYVDLLGGKLRLASQLGVGTTFSFVLLMKIGQKPENEDNASACDEPISRHLKAATVAPLLPQQGINPNQIQVLLVEDNIPALNVLKILVSKYNVQVTTAVSAELALDLVKSQPFNLIITDLGLPGQSGDEMTKTIRAYERDNQLRPVKIVGLTGHALGEITQTCLDAGMQDVYRKPISVDALKNLIEELAEQKNAPVVLTPSSIGGALGPDLPDTESQLFEINQYPLFDLQIAINSLGSASVARDILKTLKQDGVTNDLALIEQAHERGDWKTVEKLSHKIKGGACYGTVRMYYALLYMERYLKAGHTHCSEKLYAQMLRVIEESMIHLDDWLYRG